MRSRQTATLGLFLVAACVGCGPPWQVIRMAQPNPFVGKGPFAIDSVRYDGLHVGRKTEAEWLAGKDAEQRAGFEVDKHGFADRFVATLASASGGLAQPFIPGAPPTYLVRGWVQWYEPGSFNGFVNFDTEVHMVLQIVDPQGTILDEVRLATRERATSWNPASGDRMRIVGERLGAIAARYLQWRTSAP